MWKVLIVLFIPFSCSAGDKKNQIEQINNEITVQENGNQSAIEGMDESKLRSLLNSDNEQEGIILSKGNDIIRFDEFNKDIIILDTYIRYGPSIIWHGNYIAEIYIPTPLFRHILPSLVLLCKPLYGL